MKKRKLLALALAATMLFSMVGCQKGTGGETTPGTVGEGTLVIGITSLNEVFNPFFYSSAYDFQAFENIFDQVCQLDENNALMDDAGNIAAEAVTGPNGEVQTKYTVKINEGMKFHDGQKVTIDDLIFAYYVYCDPNYDGMATFRTSVDIVGCNEYYYDRADYSAAVEGFKKDAEAKAKDPEAFIQYLIDTNCEGWFDGALPGDPQGDGTMSWVQYLQGEGYDTTGIETDVVKVGALVAKCEYEKYASGYDAYTYYFNKLSKEYIKAGLEDGVNVETISGIEKVDDYTCTVLINGVNVSADRQLALMQLTPKHYYGENFKKGDVSGVRAKTAPMGSGPFKWIGFADNVITTEAFADFYKGAPKIATIKYQVITDDQKVDAVKNGDIDITDPSASKEVVEELKADGVPYSLIGNPGYGYIAINAKRIPDKNVREGLMHLLTREQAVSTYYGELATLIERPMTPTLAEYPRDAKEYWGYDPKLALECFTKAGYAKVGDKLEKGGKQLVVEIGIGDASTHPSTPILTQMANDLETMGAKLIVSDTEFSILNNRVENDDIDMYVMAWGNATDCDVTQMFGSEYTKKGGSNRTWIQDPVLDEMLAKCMTILDLDERSAHVAKELDQIMSWATYMPVYQRKNLWIYNGDTVNMDTVPKNTSTYYNYVNEIEKLELIKK